MLLAGACTALLVILLSVPPLFTWLLNQLSHFQGEFRELEGHSRLYLPALDGSWKSLWHVLPSAALNGLFEPLPGSGGQKIYLAFSVQLILIWGIVLAATLRLFSPGRRVCNPTALPQSAPPPAGSPPFIPVLPGNGAGPSGIGCSRVLSTAFSRCCLLFSLLGMLLIGFIVPFAGAIVRYRSLYLPFLLAPFLHSLACWLPLRRLNQRLAAWLPDPNSHPDPDPNSNSHPDPNPNPNSHPQPQPPSRSQFRPGSMS
jgi:hypothetical protein